jgi:cellulose synthase/poly-beta-1,6-N-acetylglucosamine synthase-like glycosyltransferase
MKVLFIGFVAGAVFLWLLTFGYTFALALAATFKKRRVSKPEPRPEIAVVVPTLNEEELILGKLDDLRKTDYPEGRFEVVVIDGGSHDRTLELVQEKVDKGKGVRLVRLTGIQKKIEQVNFALEELPQEILVFTDADSRLEPDCIRRLVGLLSSDPGLAIAGATVFPDSELVEERIHWRLVNFLWRLEGEVFASAGFSGVCYALWKKRAGRIQPEALTEDIYMALAARASGWKVRTAPDARAVELRTPRTVKGLFQYRRRRGSGYLAELVRSKPQRSSPSPWRFVRRVRIAQFYLTPWLAVFSMALGAALALTEYRMILFFGLAAFGFSAFSILFFLSWDMKKSVGVLKLTRAAARYGILILASLLTLSRHSTLQVPRGGRP